MKICFDLRVRYWPIADMPSCTAHVRFRGKADIKLVPITVLSELLSSCSQSHADINGLFVRPRLVLV
jgi:hypothetical protein